MTRQAGQVKRGPAATKFATNRSFEFVSKARTITNRGFINVTYALASA